MVASISGTKWAVFEQWMLENILWGEVTPHHVSVPFCVSIKMTKSKAIEGGGLGFILWGQFLILTCSFRCCRGAPGSSVHIVLIMGLILKGFSGEDSNNHRLGWVKWFWGGWGFKMHVCDQRAVTLNPPRLSMKIQYVWGKWMSISFLFPGRLILRHLTPDCSHGVR